mmetsp:Transcript_150172/g.280069  ORF Transcript_150172/g.280069 Transcript_150172/m.280069 type:complete len:874 (+) Transcript_150172:227-2848(+)
MSDAGSPTGTNETTGKLTVGQRVTIAGRKGTVRFLGETQFAPGVWVGVDLDDAVGKNTGTVHNVQYFSCEANHGIFVREKVCCPLEEAKPGAAAEAKDDSDDDSDGGEAPEEEPRRPVFQKTRSRRFGVSAEDRQKAAEDWKPPVHDKSVEERRQLADIIRTSRDGKLQMMFGSVTIETFEKIVDAMFMQRVAQGDNVIEQGDVGDYFYIVKSGMFEIFVKKGDADPKKVFEAGAGFAFGELALLYNAPRSATITAAMPSEVWCLERNAFRNLVVASAEHSFRASVEFLSKCDIFQELNGEQIASLAEVLLEEDFEEDEAILEQGEKDDKMFILKKGEAVACIKGDSGEVEVKQYQPGDYFGEIALLLGEPRKASVYAVGDQCSVAYITRETFHRVLGPLQAFLQRNIDKYAKYSDAIKMASDAAAEAPPPPTPSADPTAEGDLDGSKKLEVFEGGVDLEKKKVKIAMRKRDRAKTDFSSVKKAAVPEASAAKPGSEGEPMTLKEKIAQDFKDPLLVTPNSSFLVKDSHLQVFGGLVLGQTFTQDKVVVMNTEAAPSGDETDSSCSWNGPSKLKGSTHIAVVCQKGQKSASDPTPNQDNYCVLHVGAVSIYCVCDGHGPFGHLVSFRLVQTLPYLITANPNFGKDFKTTLREAFVNAQKELLEFCTERNINVEASGCAGTVLILEEQTLHVAWIGDATAMVASWNRRDSRLIFNTTDHKPNLAEEKARLEAAGSEVREVDPDNWRIYLPGSSFPGLTMSRAFGDTACAGVSQEPEYKEIRIQPADEIYAIVASDGIWEFIEPQNVVDLTSKKLRLKGPRETMRFLVEASRKRWAHVCGEYCDDITGILVQWNVPEKDATSNHTFTVRRGPPAS